ncbi:MAG: acyl-CoA thioesterase [Advenella sp.]|uniref:acyl-CoA thioesterase n=1 Tax=Advenella sp. TaxID=1872388 RepID=UPI003F9CBC0D
MDNQSVLPDLIEQLQVESLGNDVFNGISTDIFGTGRIFGGQVLGQSLMAASLTVSPGRAVHSLHSYFLRPGDTSKPIRFEVERTRDGGSFSARRVIASQLDQPIFIMSSSFQGEEPGFQHQTPAPVVTPPDSLKNEKQLIADIEQKLPKRLASLVGRDFAIEMRPVEPSHMLKPGNYDPQAHIWFRAADKLPDNPLLHRAMLAYTSDFYLLFTSLLPHNQTPFSISMQMATIDHAIWFHRPFRMDEWLLYSLESPSASNARGFCRAHVYNSKGDLIASTTQEGLIRKIEEH